MQYQLVLHLLAEIVDNCSIIEISSHVQIICNSKGKVALVPPGRVFQRTDLPVAHRLV